MAKGVSYYDEDFFLIKSDEELIKENITRILLTAVGERVVNVNFGSRLKEFLFNPGLILQEDVNSEIRSSINKWEPRVTVNSAEAEMIDTDKAHIKIELVSKETLEPFSYETILNF